MAHSSAGLGIVVGSDIPGILKGLLLNIGSGLHRMI